MGALEERLNSILPDVQLTMELEKDKQHPFLDVILTGTNSGDLTTMVYLKTTTTKRILNFFSNHKGRKLSYLRAPFSRINSYCSIQDAKRAFEENAYCEWL